MHKAFSLAANNGYGVGKKETDGKLHASKTPVRRLTPLRNCTTVSSQIGMGRRSWQSREIPPAALITLDPFLEQGQSAAGADLGALLPSRNHVAPSPPF